MGFILGGLLSGRMHRPQRGPCAGAAGVRLSSRVPLFFKQCSWRTGKAGTVWRLLSCLLQPVGGRGPWSSFGWDLQLNPQSNSHLGSRQLPLPIAVCLEWLFWAFSPCCAFAHSSHPCLSSLSLSFLVRCGSCYLPTSVTGRGLNDKISLMSDI